MEEEIIVLFFYPLLTGPAFESGFNSFGDLLIKLSIFDDELLLTSGLFLGDNSEMSLFDKMLVFCYGSGRTCYIFIATKFDDCWLFLILVFALLNILYGISWLATWCKGGLFLF